MFEQKGILTTYLTAQEVCDMLGITMIALMKTANSFDGVMYIRKVDGTVMFPVTSIKPILHRHMAIIRKPNSRRGRKAKPKEVRVKVKRGFLKDVSEISYLNTKLLLTKGRKDRRKIIKDIESHVKNCVETTIKPPRTKRV